MKQVFKRIPTFLASLMVIAAVLLVSAPRVSAASNRWVSVDHKASAAVSGFNNFSEKAVITGKNGDKVNWSLKVTNKGTVNALFPTRVDRNPTQRFVEAKGVQLRMDRTGETKNINPTVFFSAGWGYTVELRPRESATFFYTTTTVGNQPCNYRSVGRGFAVYGFWDPRNPPIGALKDIATVVGPTCVKSRTR